MRTIRASEIGTYLYCRRAWWYASQGETSQNVNQMVEGSAFHFKHGRQQYMLGCLRVIALSLLFVSLALGAVFLTRLYL